MSHVDWIESSSLFLGSSLNSLVGMFRSDDFKHLGGVVFLGHQGIGEMVLFKKK